MAANPSDPASAEDTLSLRFIQALAVPRDHLYTLALARAGSPAAAESALQQTARSLFRQTAADAYFDIPSAMEKSLSATPLAAETPETPMPADVWARLAAAIQVEAASSADTRALNADSVLLQPDPLLAPKKTKPRSQDDDPFDVSSPTRLLTLLGAVALVGLVVTLYIVTRPAPKNAPLNPTTSPGVP